MKTLEKKIFITLDNSRSVLPRLIVGIIFLSEGIRKYLFPEELETGRFEKIEFHNAAFRANFTGTFEIICGSLLLLGLVTRFAVIPLLIVMLTAFITTKWSILIQKGFWQMIHECRTDFAMTLLLICLFIYGPGKISFDNLIYKSLKT